MAKKHIGQGVKTILEFGPVVIFFIAYMRLQDEIFTIAGTEYGGFIIVTAAFVPLLLLSMAALWWLTGEISPMQVFTAVLVVFFGALTVWLNDERFFKMKTSFVYAFFAGLLGLGLILKRAWLEIMMGRYIKMTHRGWVILTRRLIFAFAVMALANEIVWRTQSTEFWVSFETFGLPAFMFVFLMTQARIMERHALPAPDAPRPQTDDQKTDQNRPPSS